MRYCRCEGPRTRETGEMVRTCSSTSVEQMACECCSNDLVKGDLALRECSRLEKAVAIVIVEPSSCNDEVK